MMIMFHKYENGLRVVLGCLIKFGCSLDAGKFRKRGMLCTFVSGYIYVERGRFILPLSFFYKIVV